MIVAVAGLILGGVDLYLFLRRPIYIQSTNQNKEYVTCSKCKNIVARYHGNPPVCANCDPKGFHRTMKKV